LRKALAGAAALCAISGLAIGVGAWLRVRSDDPGWLLAFKLFSKSLASDGLAWVADAAAPVDPAAGPITPLDGPGFYYADLSHPYLAGVRSDPRLAGLYGGGPLDVAEVARMADFVRDRVPHGRTSVDPDRLQLIELLDRAERGERYLCGTVARMLVEMVQAGGGHGRLVRLGGHVVAEFWSPRWRKWVLVDPDTNVRFESPTGVPLSVLEVHDIARRGAREELVAIAGTSPNTLFSEELLDRQLRDYYAGGFAVDFNAKWLSLDLPRWHPRRSPSVTSVYFEPGGARGHVYFDRVVTDPAALYAPPSRAPEVEVDSAPGHATP
jgi:hypothetical protein